LWCLRVGWWSPATRSTTTMDPLGFAVSRRWQAAAQQSCHIPTSLGPCNTVRHMSFELGAETTFGFLRLRFQWWWCSHEERRRRRRRVTLLAPLIRSVSLAFSESGVLGRNSTLWLVVVASRRVGVAQWFAVLEAVGEFVILCKIGDHSRWPMFGCRPKVLAVNNSKP
jgi:hypothetical protein